MCHHGHHKKNQMAHADQLYYKCQNILLLLCTPVVLIYNSELGIIISSEFFHAKKLQKKHYLLPSSFVFLIRQCIFYLFFFLRQYIFYTYL